MTTSARNTPGLTRRLLGTAGLAAALAPAWSGPLRAQAQPKRGGRITVALSPEPPTLMLGLSGQGPVQLVGGKIYDALLTYAHDLTPQPSLAKSWEVSPDGLRYTFRLQEGVTWHDGKPFTAEDVVFSMRDFLSETNPRARGLTSRIKEYATPDAQTVVITLGEPVPAFLWFFDVTTMPMIPKHLYAGTDFRNNPANATPIGTGPFRFVEWRRGELVRLARNEHYWKPGRPYLDEVVFRILPDAASRLAALENGQIDVASNYDIDPVHTPMLSRLPNLEVTNKGYEFLGHLSWLEMNNRVKPMDDRRFRQAVLHAIDRDFLAQRIWFGNAIPATGPLNQATRFYEKDTARYPFDPAKARALLDEMGLKPGADGVRVSLRMMPLPYGEVWTRMAEYIRESLGKVGIRLTLEAVDAGAWAQRLGNWDYDMTINVVGQFADPAIGVARSYVSSNIRKGIPFTNTEGYSNPQVDALFEKAAVTVDQGERAKLYSDAQKLLVQDVPVGWLLQVRFPTVLNKRFADVITTAIGVNESFDAVHLR
ncbi:ABC transporter substrate-binding protein [Roseomonas sp. OT10]|uniref:ABC transporter substrate-binding protein n=1 Tax=Roseomonas cutis TaxID=2897332 RepID=UPI001E2B7696|nr:ABC transporter substrate-binding protein [Roseomonas sp. OT10]UFN48930.1 ABC transporter substrate-binding protein [Roseomonas sp. OT10]